MLESDFIKQLSSIDQGYLHKGQNFVINISKQEIEADVQLCNLDDGTVDENVANFTEEIMKEIKTNKSENQEINFIFTGAILKSSEIIRKKWFSSFVLSSVNKFSSYQINRKLKFISDFADLCLSVYSTDGSSHAKYNLQHCLDIHDDVSYSNVQSNLIWFDHTLASGGNKNFSAYKIFYIVALATGNPVVSSSSNRLIESRFLSTNRQESATSEMNTVSKLLKQIKFTDNEVRVIFEVITALIELSQYRAQGDGKKLEFNGTGHFKKAAEYLSVKESCLRDFIINEYSWQDNKRKLKSPEFVNSEIDSFISAMYEVLMYCILDRFNKFVEMEDSKNEFTKLKFLSCPSLPDFEKEHLFDYGDFFQYVLSNIFQSISSEIINNKMVTFTNSCPSKGTQYKKMDSKSQYNAKNCFNSLAKLVIEYKNAKNKSDQFQKLEKSDFKEFKFYKINHHAYVDIFIPEYSSFIRFNWHSFVDGLDTYNFKQLNNFLKLTGNLLLKNVKLPRTAGQITDEIFPFTSSRNVFDQNMYFIHSLVDEACQTNSKYSLKSQIRNGNLFYFQIDALSFDVVPLKEFVDKYRVAFLNFDEKSRTDKDATQHAICRLELQDAWCCPEYIHLTSSHIQTMDTLVTKYFNKVITIQGYARVILAKLKLKKLKIISDRYKRQYLQATRTYQNIINNFNASYFPILNVDKENIDLKSITGAFPDFNSLEQMKSNGKDNASWLTISIMSETRCFHKAEFCSSKICVFYSTESLSEIENSMDIGKHLPNDVKQLLSNTFMLKITYDETGDVLIDVKSKEPLYIWNVKTEMNTGSRKHLPLSRGNLHSSNQYRIFSQDYFIKKLAYNTLNNIPYDSFKDLVSECSIAIIAQRDSSTNPSIVKSPLWISLTNCLPLMNLQSTSTFNAVEQERKTIDKQECGKHVNGLYMRPRNDWIMDNVSAQLLSLSLDSDNADQVDKARNESIASLRTSIQGQNTKSYYKIRKYLMKK